VLVQSVSLSAWSLLTCLPGSFKGPVSNQRYLHMKPNFKQLQNTGSPAVCGSIFCPACSPPCAEQPARGTCPVWAKPRDLDLLQNAQFLGCMLMLLPACQPACCAVSQRHMCPSLWT
jgi:hypothetical protein